MEIEDDQACAPTSSITEELSMFYSEIEGGQAASVSPAPSLPAQREESNDAESIPDDNSLDSQTSPPDSPAPIQSKKRKKVFISLLGYTILYNFPDLGQGI